MLTKPLLTSLYFWNKVKNILRTSSYMQVFTVLSWVCSDCFRVGHHHTLSLINMESKTSIILFYRSKFTRDILTYGLCILNFMENK